MRVPTGERLRLWCSAMSKKTEMTPGGSEVLRYELPEERGFEPAIGNEATLDEFVAHVEAHYGKVDVVWHEIISDRVHIDVHVIKPSAERDHYTLFTTGMSDLPMTTPPQASDFAYAELILQLPADWPLELGTGALTPRDEARVNAWYWPIEWMKRLARFPHDFGTWLGFGHTLPNGDPPEPFVPGTKLCGWLLAPPVDVEAAAQTKTLSDGRVVHLYLLHALTVEEMNLKLNKGTDALLDLFDKHRHGQVLNPTRPSLVKRKLFGLF